MTSKSKTSPQLSLILPVHNQETLIKPVVADIVQVLETTGISFEIIMVENGSTDKTLEVLKHVAEKNPRLKVYTAQKGYGSAVLTGLNKAKGQWVSYMPSDGQIDAKILTKLINEYKTGKYDMVKIYRKNRESFIRLIRSNVFNLLINIIFGKLPISDINGSPRIFHRNELERLNLIYTDSFIDTEFILKARYLGWKIREIPMENLERIGGKSTVSINTVIEFLKNIFVYRFGQQFDNWKRVNT